MTEIFGPCGQGWGFDVVSCEQTGIVNKDKDKDDQIFVSAVVNVWYGPAENSVTGYGGAMLACMENSGKINVDDDAYKKAITDALGTALKMLGVAADIYEGDWNTKLGRYKDDADPIESLLKKLQECETAADADAWASQNIDSIKSLGEGDKKRMRAALIKRKAEVSNGK